MLRPKNSWVHHELLSVSLEAPVVKRRQREPPGIFFSRAQMFTRLRVVSEEVQGLLGWAGKINR